MTVIFLLILSNVFMITAWYGHLHFKESPIWMVILLSWGLALFEYCFHVPANRLGHGQFTVSQLKIIQEVITVVVFIGFAWLYLNEPPRWNEYAAFACICLAVVFASMGR